MKKKRKMIKVLQKEETQEAMGLAVKWLVHDMMHMAKENWCPNQVEMLERLIGAVLENKKYDEWTKEEKK